MRRSLRCRAVHRGFERGRARDRAHDAARTALPGCPRHAQSDGRTGCGRSSLRRGRPPLDLEGRLLHSQSSITRSRLNDHDRSRRRAPQTEDGEAQAAQDAEVASKTIEKGLLIVHTGKGKGKSTAAFGLMMRAIGRGMKAGVVQFGKGAWDTGEKIAILARYSDVVTWHTLGEGFTWETQDRAKDVAAAERAWRRRSNSWPIRRSGSSCSTNSTFRSLRSSRSRKGGRGTFGAAARFAHRRHGTQCEARDDRGRRSRHRVQSREASLRGGVRAQEGIEF